jgi:hypothetical protein
MRTPPSCLEPKRRPTMNSVTTLMTPHSSIMPRAKTASNEKATTTYCIRALLRAAWTRSALYCNTVRAMAGWNRFPSVFGRNLHCELVRNEDTREECHWSHACKSFKRAGVGTNGIIECKFLSKNAHGAKGPLPHFNIPKYITSIPTTYQSLRRR